MDRWVSIQLALGVLVLGLAVAWFVANSSYRQRMAEAEAAWADIGARAKAKSEIYEPASVVGLPEIAQRYFNHAIALGTPLATTVELEMDGRFLLGDKAKHQTFLMRARQILAAPEEFVWIAEMSSGPVRISGTDALYQTRGWTRFWMFWSIPLIQTAATEGLDRAAAARPALEAIWAPATLLPQNGAVWTQLGEDTAQVAFDTSNARITMQMTLDRQGRVLDIVTQRWSDANPDKQYRHQPFGGTMKEEATFGGFTIPSLVHVGNHYGTDDYFAFFNARLTSARFY